ncbi:MAG: hypothetical protein PHP98_08340 [Kiritimatiellae bacterium]|nr:hypothetical protein [Kiritimatiellia bacterium]
MQTKYVLRSVCFLLCLLPVLAFANDWQWHAAGAVGKWGHSASYSVYSSSGVSVPFPSVTNQEGVSYGGFIYPHDRRVMRVRDDFDGDGKSDCWYYHQPSAAWYVVFSSATQSVFHIQLGLADSVPIPEDYDGDLITDPAIYQENTGTWIAWLSLYNYAAISLPGFGGAGISAIPADYDGDMFADPAIYNRNSGVWTATLSANGYRTFSGGFGGPGYTALIGDFDMDDCADPMIYNETAGALGVALSGSGYLPVSVAHGGNGFTMLSDDYDGDGCADFAAYKRDNGLWYITNYKYDHIVWGDRWGGGPGYLPIMGDYDGDGLADVSVFYRDRHDSIWHLDETTAGPTIVSARGHRGR